MRPRRHLAVLVAIVLTVTACSAPEASPWFSSDASWDTASWNQATWR